jgi:hypothetical protein
MNKILYKILLILSFIVILTCYGHAKQNKKPANQSDSIKIACLPHKTFIQKKHKATLLHAFELRSTAESVGGLSALLVHHKQNKIYLLSDRSYLFSADLIKNPQTNSIECLKNVKRNHLRGRSKNYLNGHYADAEGMSFSYDKKHILVSFERHHRVIRYNPNDKKLLPVKDYKPFDKKDLPFNESYESVLALNDKSIIAFPERHEIQEETLRGFYLMNDGKTLKNIHLKRLGGFWLTDLAELSNGDFVTLERSFSLFQGMAMQMRHIKRDDFLSGAVADGEIIFNMNTGDGVDNFEGLDIIHNKDGTNLMYIVSDNNFATFQKTLILSLSYKISH